MTITSDDGPAAQRNERNRTDICPTAFEGQSIKTGVALPTDNCRLEPNCDSAV